MREESKEIYELLLVFVKDVISRSETATKGELEALPKVAEILVSLITIL